MIRWRTLALVVSTCALSAGAGFGLGFREGWFLGVAADFLPRGVIATQQIRALQSGKTDFLVTSWESDIDTGLIWGHDALHHPLRPLIPFLTGNAAYPDVYEKNAARLANYRKKTPTPLKADMFDTVPPGKEQYRREYKELSVGVRESISKIDKMIERYGATP